MEMRLGMAFAAAASTERQKMSRASTTTAELWPNPTPGEILLDEFLKPRRKAA